MNIKSSIFKLAIKLARFIQVLLIVMSQTEGFDFWEDNKQQAQMNFGTKCSFKFGPQFFTPS